MSVKEKIKRFVLHHEKLKQLLIQQCRTLELKTCKKIYIKTVLIF